ncbi:hypothetical protein BDZ91DRAFT_768288 [Kalaharituber pfeilii]|nr:hypothetical protein BDZ91DRAFT_768288 [Kalaharituber pfeilii]
MRFTTRCSWSLLLCSFLSQRSRSKILLMAMFGLRKTPTLLSVHSTTSPIIPRPRNPHFCTTGGPWAGACGTGWRLPWMLMFRGDDLGSKCSKRHRWRLYRDFRQWQGCKNAGTVGLVRARTILHTAGVHAAKGYFATYCPELGSLHLKDNEKADRARDTEAGMRMAAERQRALEENG